jgi:hypothetical protein
VFDVIFEKTVIPARTHLLGEKTPVMPSKTWLVTPFSKPYLSVESNIVTISLSTTIAYQALMIRCPDLVNLESSILAMPIISEASSPLEMR